MELQYRLVKQTINIAVSKALEDMKSNTRRSIRNLIDLGLLFSHSENQKWFFTTAKKIITNPYNPYNSLVARMISDVNSDTIKKIGINLGYNSLTYGADKIQKSQKFTKCPIPWLLSFDIEYCPTLFDKIRELIHEGRELGIYSYIFCLHETDDIIPLCKIAEQFDECLFIFKSPPALITAQSVQSLSILRNVIVSVQADRDSHFECDIDAFQTLKLNKCFYGFHLNYNEDNMKKVTSPVYIRSAIELGCLFGVYNADRDVSQACKDAVYNFICSERGADGQPLTALEWSRDIQNISEKILSGGCTVIKIAGKAYYNYKKVKNVFKCSLVEILQGIKPCISL